MTGKHTQASEHQNTAPQQPRSGRCPEATFPSPEATEGAPFARLGDSLGLAHAATLGSLGREGGASTTTHARHSRKPQHVFSSKFFKDAKKKEVGVVGGAESEQEVGESSSEPMEKEEEAVSFSVSVAGWGMLSGGQVPKHCRDTTAQTVGEHRGKAEEVGPQSSESDEDEDSKSTVISLPTSLPIIFHVAASASQHGLAQRQAARDTLVTPPSFKPKSLPVLLESIKPSTPQKKVGQTPAQPVAGKPAQPVAAKPAQPSKPAQPVTRKPEAAAPCTDDTTLVSCCAWEHYFDL